MSKKFLAALLSLAMCFSLAACGSSDDDEESSSKKSTKKKSSVTTVVDDDDDDDDSSKSKKKKTTAETEEPDDETETETEKVTEKETETEKVTEKQLDPDNETRTEKQTEPEPDESKPEPVAPSGTTRHDGTGYYFYISSDWLDFDKQKDEIMSSMSDIAKQKFGVDTDSNSQMETCFYYNDGNLDDGSTNFNILKPQHNAAYKQLSMDQFAPLFEKALNTQAEGIEGYSFVSNGVKKIGNNKFLEIVANYEMDEVLDGNVKAKQFFALHGEYMYTISFSCPAKDFDSMQPEIDKIMETLTFTD